MLKDSIIFKNWPKDYSHARTANIKTHIRQMKLINFRIKKSVKRIEEVVKNMK